VKKEIKTVDEKLGIIRITTLDERWYSRQGKNEGTGLPEVKFYPSATWIAGHYPKGIAFYKWLAQNGWNESQAIKETAGRRGTLVHKGSEILEANGELPIGTIFLGENGEEERLGADELDGLLSFKRWHDETKPRLLANEMTVFGDDYAGTLDRIYEIAGRVWIVDLKTSQEIWEEHKLQISSYSNAEIDLNKIGVSKEQWDARGLAVLQLGYRKNKAGFKFTEIEDKYNLFRMARAIWENENPEAKPKQKDYPLTIKLNANATSAKAEPKEK
jgi:hypothetical protein